MEKPEEAMKDLQTSKLEAKADYDFANMLFAEALAILKLIL